MKRFLYKEHHKGSEILKRIRKFGYYLVKAENIMTSSANKNLHRFYASRYIWRVLTPNFSSLKAMLNRCISRWEIVKIMASVTQWQQTSQLKVRIKT